MDKKTKTLSELAQLVHGEVCGDPDVVIHGLGDLATARPDEITFITKAAAVIVPPAVKTAAKPLIKVKDPNLAAAVIHRYFLAEPYVPTGISKQAVIGAGCRIPATVSIGPLAVIGDRVVLGERVTVQAGTVIGDGVAIGADTLIYPNVTIYNGCCLGDRVIIHAGAVIGSDGFGYATDEQGRHVKRPHVGTVQIDDDVEIGANVCIDRATFGRTWIKQGVKIDNLVQVGHNVVIGEGSIVVAQVGIAGSATLGRGVILGGQAGVNGHIHLDDRAMVASKSGVHASLPKGAVVSGFPAMPHKEWLRASSLFARLPELFREIREIKKAVARLPKDQPGNNDSGT